MKHQYLQHRFDLLLSQLVLEHPGWAQAQTEIKCFGLKYCKRRYHKR